MKRGSVRAWIGVSVLVGTGIVLLLRTQILVGAKLASAAIFKVEREPSEVRQQIASGESEQNPDEEHSRANDDERVRQTAGDEIFRAALPSPPPPSRVLPGQSLKSDQDTTDHQEHLLPSPPARSKVLPQKHP
jgi:hypothetical protein